LKHKKKQFEFDGKTITEVRPMFMYYDLDKLKDYKICEIINKNVKDDLLYQLYKTIYSEQFDPNDTLDMFYIWIVDNYCHLTCDLIVKLNNLFLANENPFLHDYYIFNAHEYLYNLELISSYNANESKITSTNKNKNRLINETRIHV
jgi:hypothetical protein